MGYQKAKGIIPWNQGDELPEDMVARMRGWPNNWRCICGATNEDDRYICWHCGEEREFCMTASQARAVARKLNNLEIENKGLSAMLAASTLSVGRLGRRCNNAIAFFRAANRMALRLHQKMACGHERRFVVGENEGTNWCTLCEIEGLEEIARMWAASIRARSKGGKP